MSLLALALLAQLATPALASSQPSLLSQPSQGAVPPVLAFPEPGVDDSAAYQGYQTRFFRDAAGNTVQIYVDGREGRVVNLLADAENESVGFTARDARGRLVPMRWGGGDATVSRDARARTIEYALVADAPALTVGHFLLGSMRVERDFQHFKRGRLPFVQPAYPQAELERLLVALGRLSVAERTAHLALVNAPTVAALRARLEPTVALGDDSEAVARVTQPSIDARDTLALELRVDPARVTLTRSGRAVTLRARDGGTVPFVVRVTTTGRALTPLSREQIFTATFLRFLDSARATVATAGSANDTAAAQARLTARLMERQARGVELLASREKFMAGLPTYATYFGRDLMVSALMMQGVWRGEALEAVIASVLRNLAPDGQVSHEEALGGQAVREAAAEYAALVDSHLRATRAGRRGEADSLMARARSVLADARRTRQNYHMVDDEYQLPVLVARWLADADVSAERKRAFLLDATDGEARLARLVRELALVARMTDAYVRDPVPANLVSFPPREAGPGGTMAWASTSWRDSNVGYAGGRYAMDVNAVWVPRALAATGEILAALRALDLPVDSLVAAAPELGAGSPLGAYARDSLALRRAVELWRGAERHFVVRLGPNEVRSRVASRLAALPAAERAHWAGVLRATRADGDSLTFLALALDAGGRPIRVANTDPATRLFLADSAGAGAADLALRDARLFVRAYPAGLFIDRVGPVVANDAYAAPNVWQAFERDRYHGPRVAWGREVNLFLLGVARHVAGAGAGQGAYAAELRAAAERVQAAVEASGFQSELWSYAFEGGRPTPVRYGSGADVQLWSTTDLAVQYALARLRR